MPAISSNEWLELRKVIVSFPTITRIKKLKELLTISAEEIIPDINQLIHDAEDELLPVKSTDLIEIINQVDNSPQK